jgi:hypothetical protein
LALMTSPAALQSRRTVVTIIVASNGRQIHASTFVEGRSCVQLGVSYTPAAC